MNNQNLIMKLIGGMIAQTNYMLGQMSRPLLGRTAPIWNPPWPGVVKSGGQPAQRMTERPKPSSSGAAERSPSRTPRTASSKETTKTKALQSLLNPSGYTASKISPEDLSHIIALYGSSVEDIYELGAGQRWMLEEGQHVKNAFFLQILTKAVIRFDPPAFRQQAEEVCRNHENLRSAFVMKGLTKPYRVVLKDRHPEINCFDLSNLDMEAFDEKIRKLMETDRQRGFDLEKDPLLRISIYKSCEKDTYAIIVSQPHVNSDGTSLGILFSDLFIGYALDMNGIDKRLEKQSYQAYAEHLNHVDTQKELSFWKDRLNGIEDDQLLPGQQVSDLDYDSTSYFMPFEEGELALLKQAQKRYGVTQFTLLQGIWGIMAARLKKREQIVFGAITSGRDVTVSDSMRLGGGFVNALPMKISFVQEELLSDFFKRVQREFLGCMENSHVSPGQIAQALGRDKPAFSHILNLHNFAKPRSSGFAQEGFSGIRFIGGDVYDNLSADLCVYFTVVDGRMGCQFSYNSRAFSREVIQIFAESFKTMLDALKDAPDNMTIEMLPELDTGLIGNAEDTRRIEQVKIAASLKKHPVFQDGQDEELLRLASFCHLEHYAEDEVMIRRGERRSELPILLHGKAILYGETRDGWSNPLRISKEGSILSFSPLFEEEKTNNMMANSSEEAVVLNIPMGALMDYLADHPDGVLEIARLLYEERSAFIKLWTNAN